MIELDAGRLLAECVAQGIEACANHREAMLAYTALANSVTGASADLFVLGESLASTFDPGPQVGQGNAVAKRAKRTGACIGAAAHLSAIINGNPFVRWSRYALWPEITKPTLHVLNWMPQAEPDDGRK